MLDMALSRLSSRSNGISRPLSAAFSRFISMDTTPITIETSLPFTTHLCDPPSRSVESSSQELLTFFHTMSLIRRMDIAADSLYKAKLIRGFCHLYDGQEVVAIGMEVAITKKDAIITAYRDHCIFMGRGGLLHKVFLELMGRQAGCSKGKSGSMHFYKKESSLRWSWDCRCSGSTRLWDCFRAEVFQGGVTFAMYGDGAANQGQLFEALNIYALRDLPANLVCENMDMLPLVMESTKNPSDIGNPTPTEGGDEASDIGNPTPTEGGDGKTHVDKI